MVLRVNWLKSVRVMGAMMTLFGLGITAVMAAPTKAPVRSLPIKVEIFTTDKFPVAGIEELKRLLGDKNVIVYALDGVEKVEKEFPILGAKDKESAITLGRQVFAANRTEITKRVAFGFEGVYRSAFEYGLQRYPAIIFDQKWVAYGTRDAGFALRQFMGSGRK